MLRIYYSSNRNSMTALQRYFEEYPEREQPAQNIFQRLDRNLSDYGQLGKPRQKYGNRITEDEIQNVLGQVCNMKLHKNCFFTK